MPNPFRRSKPTTIARVSAMAKKPKKAAPKAQPKTAAEAGRQAGVKVRVVEKNRARIEPGDDALVRGWKKSLPDGVFSQLRPPMEDKPVAPKRKSPDERLEAVFEEMSVGPWERLAIVSEIRQEQLKAKIRKQLEAQEAKK
jgi:hypothetical protein